MASTKVSTFKIQRFFMLYPMLTKADQMEGIAEKALPPRIVKIKDIPHNHLQHHHASDKDKHCAQEVFFQVFIQPSDYLHVHHPQDVPM